MNIDRSLKTQKYSLHFIFSILFVSSLVLNTFAQKNDTIVSINKDPEKILRRIDVRDITRNGLTPWKKDFSGHFAGIDFGFNSFLKDDYTGYDSEFMDNNVFRSNSVYFNIAQQSFGLQKNRNTFGLLTGLGLHLQSYRLNDNTTIFKDENDVVQAQYLYLDDSQKSKFSITSLTIPLLLEWQIPVNHYDNRMYLSTGILGSLRLSSHAKIKYKADKKQKLKEVDDFSMHTFKYSFMLRAGYRWFNIFATYDLLPLFKEDKGPELVPFTFGITLLRF